MDEEVQYRAMEYSSNLEKKKKKKTLVKVLFDQTSFINGKWSSLVKCFSLRQPKSALYYSQSFTHL